MAINSQTKTLLAVAAILLLIFVLYKRREAPVHNDGSVEMDNIEIQDENTLPENMEEESYTDSEDSVDVQNRQGTSAQSEAEAEAEFGSNISSQKCDNKLDNSKKFGKKKGYSKGKGTKLQYNNMPIPKEDMVRYFPQKDYAPPESDWLKMKFNSRNKSKKGFKRASYSGALRGNLGPSDWDDYFDNNNNVIGNSQTGENDKFLPIDESNGGFAVFKSKGRTTCGSNQNCEPEDLFDVDKYLPQEVNDDWFEVQPEPISIKNRHLINITKPIGINTIGTSLKNASHDIRGNPSCPKFVVSPWLQSSIEPDTNLKPLL